MKVTDDESGVKRATVYYQFPVTKKSGYIRLKYNENTDRYEESLDITDQWEEGKYVITCLVAADNLENELLRVEL